MQLLSRWRLPHEASPVAPLTSDVYPVASSTGHLQVVTHVWGSRYHFMLLICFCTDGRVAQGGNEMSSNSWLSRTLRSLFFSASSDMLVWMMISSSGSSFGATDASRMWLGNMHVACWQTLFRGMMVTRLRSWPLLRRALAVTSESTTTCRTAHRAVHADLQEERRAPLCFHAPSLVRGIRKSSTQISGCLDMQACKNALAPFPVQV